MWGVVSSVNTLTTKIWQWYMYTTNCMTQDIGDYICGDIRSMFMHVPKQVELESYPMMTYIFEVSQAFFVRLEVPCLAPSSWTNITHIHLGIHRVARLQRMNQSIYNFLFQIISPFSFICTWKQYMNCSSQVNGYIQRARNRKQEWIYKK